EDGFDALLAQAINHIGGYARLDGLLDHGAVGMVDKHGHGPLDSAGQREEMLERVALWVFQIDDDDVGRYGLDRARHIIEVMNDGHTRMAGLAQTIFNDGCTGAVFVEYQDGR